MCFSCIHMDISEMLVQKQAKRAEIISYIYRGMHLFFPDLDTCFCKTLHMSCGDSKYFEFQKTQNSNLQRQAVGCRKRNYLLISLLFWSVSAAAVLPTLYNFPEKTWN